MAGQERVAKRIEVVPEQRCILLLEGTAGQLQAGGVGEAECTEQPFEQLLPVTRRGEVGDLPNCRVDLLPKQRDKAGLV